MSKPRCGWWSYAKYMIRRYPFLAARLRDLKSPPVTPSLSGMPFSRAVSDSTALAALRELPPAWQREYEAVAAAVAETLRRPDGQDRMRLVRLVFWQRSHTLEGAAMEIPVSYRTARRWHTQFILLVGEKYGFEAPWEETCPEKLAPQSQKNEVN